MNKTIIAIGGGELRNRETLKIDEFIAEKARLAAGERRPCGLFLPTASHDCMPYYNTFHKVYTGIFHLKTDVALTLREFDFERMRLKFDQADFLYIGGGDTVFMIEHWKKTGLISLIEEAYQSGKLICGLSAGAICWFEQMYSDSVVEGEYHMFEGLGWVKGTISPHYNERMSDFDEIVRKNRLCAWGLENGSALEIVNGEAAGTISSGGKVWRLDGGTGKEVVKSEFTGSLGD